jgi:hypothetical protein
VPGQYLPFAGGRRRVARAPPGLLAARPGQPGLGRHRRLARGRAAGPRQLSAEDYRDFDWLLCADRANLREVRARAPQGARARSALLLDWCGTVADGEIPDPYTGGPAQFEHVFDLLDRAADGAIARLRQELRHA